MWNVLDSGKKSASYLMEKDEHLLKNMKRDDAPTLHFYDFIKPSFTFGVFIKPAEIMNPKTYIKDFDFSKRPTGGGVLFHVWDFAFSCFIPKNHPGYLDDVMDSYKFINDKVAAALAQFTTDADSFHLLDSEPSPLTLACKNFCFAKPTKYDIMYAGKKLAGAAQRRKGEGYLHQGSISLVMPEFDLLEPLFHGDSKVLAAMQMHTHPLLGSGATAKDREDARALIKERMLQAFVR